MFKNYLLIIARNIRTNSFYVLVNVLGLGIAIACCVIAFTNYQFDKNFDAFHSKKDTVFRVDSRKASNSFAYGITPFPLGKEAAERIPEVKQAVRLYSRNAMVKSGQTVFNENLHFVDGGFFDLFDFPIISGSAAELEKPESIMLTAEMAKKYFGDADPLGKSIEIFAGETYQKAMKVVAIVGEYPFNSSIQFDMVAHLDHVMYQGQPLDQTDWARFTDVTFLELNQAETKERVEEQLAQFVPLQNSNREDWKINGFLLDPLSQMAHHSKDRRADYLRESIPPSAVWGPNVMALLLLLAACLNFMNTTIALSNRRLKEMGVRKVMGGSRRQLVLQLLGESFAICLLAFGLSLLLVEVLMPMYNAMWNFVALEANYLDNLPLAAFLVFSLFGVTLLAGAYPAFYISSFNVTQIFKGKVRFSGNTVFSRLMLGSQIMIALVALVGGFVFARNAAFQRTADMGYLKEGVMSIPVLDGQSYEILKEKALQNPQVIKVAGASDQIGSIYRNKEIKWRDQDLEARLMGVGEGYLDLMQVGLAEGRFLDGQRASDFEQTIMVNERLLKQLSIEDPLNQQLSMDSINYTIVGVVKDFYQTDFFDPIEPLIIRLIQAENYELLALTAPVEKLVGVNQYLMDQWTALFPYRPYSGFFQDQVLAQEAMITNNVKWLFIFCAVVTVLLTIVGLFALVSLNIVRRMKEIAIRRVVGANVRQIAVLLNRKYFFITLGGILIGSVGGYLLAKSVLDSIFAVHVGVEAWVLIVASIGVLAIVLLTIGLKMLGITHMNPSKILRAE